MGTGTTTTLSRKSFTSITKPEDHWSCITDLSAEDMLISAVIEEKKFKHSPWTGADNPLGPKFWCQQEGLITLVICCKFKKNLWLYTSFNDLINVYSLMSGADNPRGQNFDFKIPLVTSVICYNFQKNLFEVWFYTIFFTILYMYIAPGAGAVNHWGQNFDVNRNILSVWSFVASLKKITLKPDFI